MTVVPITAAKRSLDNTGRKLRAVVIERAYDTIQDPHTQRLLGQIAALKIGAYRRIFPYGVLPVDTTDFTSTHILLCEETPEGLDPLLGVKVVTNRDCHAFGIPFPAYHYVEGSHLVQHKAAIEAFMAGAERKNQTVGYVGAWTYRADLKSERLLVSHFHNITAVFLLRYFQEKQIETGLAFAVMRFKVEEFHEYMGWPSFSSNGIALPAFNSPGFFNEPMRTSHIDINQFSKAIEPVAGPYEALWSKRMVILGAEQAGEVKSAA